MTLENCTKYNWTILRTSLFNGIFSGTPILKKNRTGKKSLNSDFLMNFFSD